MTKVVVDHKDLMKQAKHFQYIRFVLCDVNGISKGKSAAKSAFDQLSSGMGLYNGCLVMGPASEIPLFLEKSDPICAKNGLLLPAVDKITPASWAPNPKYAIGEVICELSNNDTGELLEMNPRTVARKQLERLQSHGLRLLSSFELEGLILSKNGKPISEAIPCMSILPLSMYEEVLYDFEQQCHKAGIQIENFHCEYDPGQLEFSFKPTYGIKCADDMFRFKHGFKEMCLHKGYCGTFMTKPTTIETSNGAHFNFSLWTKDNRNAFYDPSAPDKLSQTCLYFIGGILSHLNAVIAFCAPTVNCYRRFFKLCVPWQDDWEIDNRYVALRVKNNGEQGTYIECRVPSGSSNAYLVTAAVLAAGLDGIENKTTPPPRGRGKSTKPVPSTLAEAISALKNDDALKTALGERFITWFLACKENYEISRFGCHDMKCIREKELEIEREEYLYYF